MPEIAASMESAVLSAWLVAEGAPFSAKDVIAVIETDKAVVDFEAEAGGTMIRRLVQDGTDVPVGAAIALIATPGEAIDDVDAVLAQMGEASTSAAAPSGAAADSQPTPSGQDSAARERWPARPASTSPASRAPARAAASCAATSRPRRSRARRPRRSSLPRPLRLPSRMLPAARWTFLTPDCVGRWRLD